MEECKHEDFLRIFGFIKKLKCYNCNKTFFYEEEIKIIGEEEVKNSEEIKNVAPISIYNNRKSGYYWLRTECEWRVGNWNGLYWHLIDTELHYCDKDFDEINEIQIKNK